MDDQELDRIDLCHTKYYALLNKKHYLSPIPDTPQRILDLGCGTGFISLQGLTYWAKLIVVIGIWSVEMADKFPSAEV